jgi:hypothetical protein
VRSSYFCRTVYWFSEKGYLFGIVPASEEDLVRIGSDNELVVDFISSLGFFGYLGS